MSKLTIHSICGSQNNGKTLFMTIKAYEDYLTGRPVISNYSLGFSHYLVNKDFVFWLAKEQPNFKNITFAFDELWLWFDSRKAIENTLATYFFLQSSKGNSNIYLTAQHNEQNELRIRQNLNTYTETNRFLKVGNKLEEVKSKVRDLGDNFNDYLYIQTKTRERKQNMLFNVFSAPEIIYYKAKKFFKLYNTYEKKKII